MISADRAKLPGFLLLLAVAFASRPAFAEISIVGDWRKMEEALPVIGESHLGDFTALPIRPTSLPAGDSWDESRWTMLERGCSPYGLGGPGGYRGPGPFRATEVRDPTTQKLVAIKTFVATFAQERTIWMDGRPHPSKYAPHTWQGFSTGTWNGNMLAVTTTHIKQFWHRRNGIFSSDNMTVTERFIRHGKYLTWVMMTEDPQYLTEPLVYSENFELATDLPERIWQTHLNCQVDEEIAGHPNGYVPHVMWDSTRGREYATQYGIPFEATRGGAETMYPEYIATLKKLMGAATRAASSR